MPWLPIPVFQIDYLFSPLCSNSVQIRSNLWNWLCFNCFNAFSIAQVPICEIFSKLKIIIVRFKFPLPSFSEIYFGMYKRLYPHFLSLHTSLPIFQNRNSPSIVFFFILSLLISLRAHPNVWPITSITFFQYPIHPTGISHVPGNLNWKKFNMPSRKKEHDF